MSLKESERCQIEQQTGLLLAETGTARNSRDFYDILQKQSLKLQKRAADIVRCLQVDEMQVQSDLFNALQHFQRRDGQIEKNAPQDFLSKQQKDFLNLGSDKFTVSLYKVLLFQQLSVGIKSGTVNFSDSHKYTFCNHLTKYRSLDDYLISREFWQKHRSELLGQADLQESDNFPAILTNLSDTLDRAFRETNQQLKSNLNPHLKFTADRDWVISTPKQDATLAAPLKNYFPSRQLVPLSEVLASVNQAVPFLDELQHWQMRRRQSKPVDQVFFAGIIGTGCELGIGKMAFISKHIGEIDLENTVNWYFSPENLQNANAKIVNFLNNLELPNLLRRSQDRLHTSSDGQKYAVSVPSLNANHSFKYFGHDKGVTVYSFIDERHLLFYSTVISAAEREAAYVIDGLLHNEVIKSDIHSTDSHGFTEIVFGVTHLLGFSFAPRLKQLSKHRLYSFEKRKIYEALGCRILPKLYIDTKLIEDNWDDILRFVATIKLKHTTASQLFKRLNSYSKQHPLYQALKEFGKIIKTLFILRYIDDVELRRAIEKQLNKIEHAHRFAKAVAFANNQEFSEGEKELQNVAADCRRLIENSIICWNYLYLTNKLTEMSDKHQRQSLLESIKDGSIITWKHINFHGEYDFSAEKMQDSVGLNLPKILAWKAE
ncbi:MAG: Tn3 family transposase [Pyrinomonadaceae bacterium]